MGQTPDAIVPLFPLGSVLVPGLVLPLHVFEPRYRALVADLLDRPEEEREFGVVAIREGHEVGADNVTALFDVGCTARIVGHQQHPDGRYDVVTTGQRRFSLLSVDTGEPLLRGGVRWQAEPAGEDAGRRADLVRLGFAAYRDRIVRVSGVELADVPQLPDDPTVLSYLVSSAMVLDLADRQRLLEVPDTGARLAEELRCCGARRRWPPSSPRFPPGTWRGCPPRLN